MADLDPGLADRVRRAEEVLTRVAEGDLDQRLEISPEYDALTSLEMGINFLVVDLRQTDQQNREQRATLVAQQRDLEAKLQMIERQADAIRELATPIMEIWDDVLVLPIVGIVDTKRSAEIMTALLASIAERRAKCVIIDVTGVEVVDTGTADYLIKVVRAASLLGARCVLTGLSPAISQTLVAIGADMSEVHTLRNLKAGLVDCLRFLRGAAGR